MEPQIGTSIKPIGKMKFQIGTAFKRFLD